MKEGEDICEPFLSKDVSEQVFLVTSDPFQILAQKDQGMNYDGNIYYHSIALQTQHPSSKHTSLHNMHDK